MAATSSNPPSTSSKPSTSPVPSAASSILSNDTDKFKLPPPSHDSATLLLPNGDSKSASGASGASTPLPTPNPQKKPGMTSRMLSGMFGRKDEQTRENRAGSVTNGDGPVETKQNAATVGKPTPHKTSENRFWMKEDGTHEHRLIVAKRREKLGDLFKDMLGRKKEVQHDNLSLMSNWVDVMKNEKEKVAAEQKLGSHPSTSLVEKYGKCQEVVGRGAFGTVRVAHKPDSKDPRREQLYAVKEFHQRPGENPKKYQKRLTSEFCLSSSMAHPNVIKTLDLMQDDKGQYCEVMEYCAGGDLYTLILAAGQLEVLEADCFFKQLMRGVEYMHEMGVAHRDLKPENLLLTQHGALKITDFGNGECFRMAWEKDAHMTAGLCGSAPYIAPEEYVDPEFDPRAVDVWACGIIYMAMRTGRHLWRLAQKSEDEFYTKYLEDRKEDDGYRPIEVLKRKQCRNVVYSILDPNPTRRLTAHQVCMSEWVESIDVCHAGTEGF